MDIKNKPFSRGYVLRTTAKHIQTSIEISIEKTTARIKEFEDNIEKSKELLETLSVLFAQKKMHEEFLHQNKALFSGE